MQNTGSYLCKTNDGSNPEKASSNEHQSISSGHREVAVQLEGGTRGGTPYSNDYCGA
jgi:hypothetical protein